MNYRKLNIKKIFYFIYLGVFLVLFFLPTNVLAIAISPLRQTAVIDPGKSETAVLEVFNDEKKDLIVVPEVDAFSIDSKTGQAIFGKEDKAKDWITVKPSQMKLSPGEKGEFSFLVSVPENIEPRSHYLGLFAKQIPGAGQVGIGSRVGSLFFLHIAGLGREEIIKQKFETDKKVYFNTPVILKVELKNTGTIHLVPSGEVVLTDKNNQIISKFVLNPTNRKVLPNETWQAEYVIGEEILKNKFGRIEMQSQINFGQTHGQIVIEKEFWLVPVWMLWLVGNAVIALIIFFFLIKIFYKRRRVL